MAEARCWLSRPRSLPHAPVPRKAWLLSAAWLRSCWYRRPSESAGEGCFGRTRCMLTPVPSGVSFAFAPAVSLGVTSLCGASFPRSTPFSESSGLSPGFLGCPQKWSRCPPVVHRVTHRQAVRSQHGAVRIAAERRVKSPCESSGKPMQQLARIQPNEIRRARTIRRHGETRGSGRRRRDRGDRPGCIRGVFGS